VRLNPVGCTVPVFTHDGFAAGAGRGAGGGVLLWGFRHGHGRLSQSIFTPRLASLPCPTVAQWPHVDGASAGTRRRSTQETKECTLSA
jgi:hypothetical protein